MIALLAIAAILSPSLAVKPCCSPDQWEASVGGLGGTIYEDKPVGVVDGDRLHYDYTNKKYAVNYRMMATNGYQNEGTMIVDHTKKMAYSIRGPNCTEFAWQDDMRQDCVGADDKFLTHFYFGVGKRHLPVNSWTSSPEADVHLVFGRAQGTCAPVMMNELRTGSRPEVKTAFIVNITPGIKDNSVFTPPANCKKAPGVPQFLEKEPMFQLAKRMFTK